MDQKLYMPDILDQICAHIGPMDDEYASEVRGHLAALARTCKTFQDPALDALWRFQYSLVPALRCFPDDLWKRSDNARHTFVVNFQVHILDAISHVLQEFSRPLQPTDWERPMYYWNRVNSFQIGAIKSKKLSLSVCEALRIGSPNGTPFPNLRDIRCFDRNPAHFPVFDMFLSSSRLNSIGLALEATDPLFLPTLGDRYPDLTRLELQGNFEPDSLESTLALLSKLNRLEWVWIPQADAAILERLAHIPTLKVLVVETIMPFQSFPERDCTTSRFGSLEHLEVPFTAPHQCITLVDALESQALKFLYLGFSEENPDSLTITRFYTAVAATSSYSTLEYLMLQDNKHDSTLGLPAEDEFDNYVVRGTTLRILFPFAHLTNVSLIRIYGFDLDDEVVTEMAQAWARIVRLKLGYTKDPSRIAGGRTRVTLVGIHAIATHCRDLEDLDIAFDATKVPQLDYHMLPQTTLIHFGVLCSPISSSIPVAVALSAMFPNLCGASWGCGEFFSEDGPPHWGRVNIMLRKGSFSDEGSDEDYY
ncbi:hypothetical protein K438DRAFT_1785764 [Mycena galopus ATCC 62051]|nr:hypothetical protein K438DRAFT_1785764 [Mycena galopus ATCC 62051]